MSARVSRTGQRKIDRAVATGWTAVAWCGPCRWLKLHRKSRRDRRKGAR